MVERDLEAVGVAADHVVGLGQRAERGAQCLEVGPALLAEFGSPSGLREQAAGDPVDEPVEDLVDVGTGAERAHGGHRRGERVEHLGHAAVVGPVGSVDPPRRR